MDMGEMIRTVGSVFWPLTALMFMVWLACLAVIRRWMLWFGGHKSTLGCGDVLTIILSVLAGTSMLLGLLGTVNGMAFSTAKMSVGDPASIGFLVAGLSTALTSTQMGLYIAIVAALGGGASELLDHKLDAEGYLDGPAEGRP